MRRNVCDWFPNPGAASSTSHPSSANRFAARSQIAATSGSTGANRRSADHATRNPLIPGLRSTSARNDPGYAGTLNGSSGSWYAITSSASAASATVRVIGPRCVIVDQPPGLRGTRPYVAFSPNTPQIDAGMRIEPPPSLPSAMGPNPAATAAAAPPLDPPAMRAGSHGFVVVPNSLLCVI